MELLLYESSKIIAKIQVELDLEVKKIDPENKKSLMQSMLDLEKWRCIDSDSRMKDGKLNSSRIATSPPKIISNTSIVSSSSDSLKK